MNETRQGSLATGDSTYVGALTTNRVVSNCTNNKTCPGIFGASTYRYDAHTFANPTNAPLCVNVTLQASACGSARKLFSATYLSSFNPASLCTNYLADRGSGNSVRVEYNFTVPANATFVVVVEELEPNTGCDSYTLIVKSCAS